MKKLSFALLITLLLGLCSCAPAPNGAEIFNIKDPESITRITVDNSVWEPIEMTDISGAVEALSTATLTRINPDLHDGGTQVTLYYGDQTQGLNFSGTTVWIDNKAYRCDTDISQIFSKVVHPES